MFVGMTVLLLLSWPSEQAAPEKRVNCKSGCVYYPTVFQGPALMEDFHLRYLETWYDSRDPQQRQLEGVSCAKFAIQKRPVVFGDIYTYSVTYLNRTSKQQQRKELYYAAGPHAPLSFVRVTADGNNPLPNDYMRAIYKKGGYVVYYDCLPGVEGKTDNCAYRWRLFGRGEVTPEDWGVLKKDLAALGLKEVETVKLINQTICTVK